MTRRGFNTGIALAEKRARDILAALGLSSLSDIDLRDLAFDRGLLLQTRPIQGAEGRLVRRGAQAIATVSSTIVEFGKRRFVAAHELGHFELHVSDRIFVCDENAFFDWNNQRPAETEANRFAAELLLPRTRFVAEARSAATSFELVEDLAAAYQVSLMAASFRYVDLNVAPCALVFCRGGRIEWSLTSASLPLQYIGPRRAAHAESGAGEYFRTGHTSRQPEWTPVEAWFMDDTLIPGTRYLEQCRPMPSYNGCLSLIWNP